MATRAAREALRSRSASVLVLASLVGGVSLPACGRQGREQPGAYGTARSDPLATAPGNGTFSVDLYFDPVRQLHASGWYEPYVNDRCHYPENTNFFVGVIDGDYRNFLSFDLSEVSGQVSAATLTVRNDFRYPHDYSPCQEAGSGVLTLYAVDTALRELLDGSSCTTWHGPGVRHGLRVDPRGGRDGRPHHGRAQRRGPGGDPGQGRQWRLRAGRHLRPVLGVLPYGYLFACSDGAAPGAARLALVTTPPAYPLTVRYRGDGSGMVTGTANGSPIAWESCTATQCTANVPVNAAVILTETPDAGMLFRGWGNACAGTATACAFDMDGAKRAVAVFGKVHPPGGTP